MNREDSPEHRTTIDRLMKENYRSLMSSASFITRNNNGSEPEELVNKLWLSLSKCSSLEFENTAAFMAYCKNTMQNILKSEHRRDTRLKRGGDKKHIDWDTCMRMVNGEGKCQ